MASFVAQVGCVDEALVCDKSTMLKHCPIVQEMPLFGYWDMAGLCTNLQKRALLPLNPENAGYCWTPTCGLVSSHVLPDNTVH